MCCHLLHFLTLVFFWQRSQNHLSGRHQLGLLLLGDGRCGQQHQLRRRAVVAGWLRCCCCHSCTQPAFLLRWLRQLFCPLPLLLLLLAAGDRLAAWTASRLCCRQVLPLLILLLPLRRPLLMLLASGCPAGLCSAARPGRAGTEESGGVEFRQLGIDAGPLPW